MNDTTKKTVRLAEQYAMTVEEAAIYFRIGENKLRWLIQNNPDAAYLLRIGNRVLIKRHLFELYLDEVSEI